ncbi:MAG: class I SAM-dependent methyltransferase [Dermatophilaceae bacterium]
MTADVYAELGEFHDLFMVQPWERLRPHVRQVLGGLPASAVVIELGAGSGMGTRVLASESAASVVALEPSLVMRSVLLARVADSPDLSERVTVHAGSVPGDLGLLPERVDAAVCTHVLGHLTAEERRMTFAWLAAHLTPAGAVLVTTQDPVEPVASAQSPLVEARRIGTLDYSVAYEEPPGSDGFQSRYVVRSGTTVVRDVVIEGSWEPLSVHDLRRELSGTDLDIEALAPGVAVLRRRVARAAE